MRHTAHKPDFRKALTPDLLYTYTTTVGNRVYVRARSTDGGGVFVEQTYAPTYYLPTDTFTGVQSIDGQPLLPVPCATIREGKKFLEEHPDAFGDIQPEYMLLADVYGDMDITVDMDRLYLWNLDIETESETAFAPPEDPFNAVTAITVTWRHMGQRGTVVYGLRPFDAPEGTTYVQCDTEEDLLHAFLKDWRGKGDYPDIITGWNVQFFDIPYLVNRYRRVLGDDAAVTLSPFKQISDRQLTLNGRAQTVMDIRGVAVLDYYELYRKFTFSQQESYRLDHIAHVELGKRKLSYAEYQSLSQLYRENYQKFIEYNIQDVQLVEDLDDKMKLIDLVCALAYSAKANYTDTFKQVRLWDIMIYHYLRAQGKQIPPRREVDKSEQYTGAYVKEPQVGQHAWVCSFDINSLYPHIIREWNLSPETLMDRSAIGQFTIEELLDRKIDTSRWVGETVNNDNALAANGMQTSRRHEGFLPAMLRTMYEQRVATQKELKPKKKLLEAVNAEIHRRKL